MKKTVYAGTYTGNGSEGIYRFQFEDGILSCPELHCRIKNPKYITMQDGIIASACDLEDRSGAALISREGEILDTVAYESGTSCYIGRYGNDIYTANYHEGTFSALQVRENNTLKYRDTVTVRNGAGCHQVLVWNDQVLVPSLFLDRVMIYDSSFNRTGSIRFNSGTGPRHGVFSHDGEYLYLVSELSNELFVIKTGTWEILHSIPVLPNNETNKRDSAAIRLSDDGKYIYVSTRTRDIISVIELNGQVPALIQVVSCGGRHPRDFILLDGYLLSANRFSHTVVSFRIHEDGTIGRKVSEITIPEAVSLVVDQ